MRVAHRLLTPLFMSMAVNAHGQSPHAATDEVSRRIKTIIVLDESLPTSERVQISRFARGLDRDIVRVSATANGPALVQALRALDIHRQHDGDSSMVDVTIRAGDGPYTRVGTQDESHADDIIRRLSNAPLRTFPGLGRVHTLTIFMPSQQMRASGAFGTYQRKSAP